MVRLTLRLVLLGAPFVAALAACAEGQNAPDEDEEGGAGGAGATTVTSTTKTSSTSTKASGSTSTSTTSTSTSTTGPTTTNTTGPTTTNTATTNTVASTSSGGNCLHDSCTVGTPLDPSCSACADLVCNFLGQTTCCASQWDDTCALFGEVYCACGP